MFFDLVLQMICGQVNIVVIMFCDFSWVRNKRSKFKFISRCYKNGFAFVDKLVVGR